MTILTPEVEYALAEMAYGACIAPMKSGPGKGGCATGTPTGAFRHRRAGEDVCDPCLAASNKHTRDWRLANPETAAATHKRFRDKDPEAWRARTRQWRIDNPEVARESTKRSNRKKYLKNPDTYKNARRKRAAQVRNATIVPFAPRQLEQRLSMTKGLCWICQQPGPDSVDHVIALARGGPHCLANLRPAHRSCNSSKGAAPWRQSIT